jgi:hypothetical protein
VITHTARALDITGYIHHTLRDSRSAGAARALRLLVLRGSR